MRIEQICNFVLHWFMKICVKCIKFFPACTVSVHRLISTWNIESEWPVIHRGRRSSQELVLIGSCPRGTEELTHKGTGLLGAGLQLCLRDPTMSCSGPAAGSACLLPWVLLAKHRVFSLLPLHSMKRASWHGNCVYLWCQFIRFQVGTNNSMAHRQLPKLES